MAEITDFDKTRIIKLEGAYNTRDLGGFKVIGDGMVRRGLVFRSDELNCLTDKDAAKLDTFGIKTVVDFRSGGEIMRSKDWRPHGVCAVELSIDCGDLGDVLGGVSDHSGPKLMESVNRRLVKEAGGIYREFSRCWHDARTFRYSFTVLLGRTEQVSRRQCFYRRWAFLVMIFFETTCFPPRERWKNSARWSRRLRSSPRL